MSESILLQIRVFQGEGHCSLAVLPGLSPLALRAPFPTSQLSELCSRTTPSPGTEKIHLVEGRALVPHLKRLPGKEGEIMAGGKCVGEVGLADKIAVGKPPAMGEMSAPILSDDVINPQVKGRKMVLIQTQWAIVWY